MTDPKPRWLEDNPDVLAWLHAVLDRLERTGETRTGPVRFTVDARLFPSLFHFGPEADGRWELLTRLAGHGLPVTITLNRRRNEWDPEYVGARLAVDPKAEECLRAWLQRPRTTPEARAWCEAVDAAETEWSPDARARLRERRLRIVGRSADEVVAGFQRLGLLKDQGLTLRQLSAAAFYGDSKFIERHCAALVDALYPALVAAPRPLVVDVSLPTRIEGVLFIENQDSYLHAAAGRVPDAEGLALVYAAGFKGGATRIRDPGCAALHYAGGVETKVLFEAWWFGADDADWPAYFWGDLDFEGMGILKQLRRLFRAQAWAPGYTPLLCVAQGRTRPQRGSGGQIAAKRSGIHGMSLRGRGASAGPSRIAGVCGPGSLRCDGQQLSNVEPLTPRRGACRAIRS